MVENGVDGALVPPDDPEGLGEALAALLGDPEALHELGAAARAKAEREFSAEVHLARLNRLYDEAAGKQVGV